MQTITYVMEEPGKVLFDVTADPAEIEKRLKTKQLCFILNKNLKPRQIARIIEKNVLMAVEYNGKIRHGVVCGLYKEAPADFEKITSDTESAKMWKEEGDNPVLEVQIDNPLSIILSHKLAPIQLEMSEQVYEIINVEYECRSRKAIACAYYEPDIPIEGGILSQEWGFK